MAQNFTGFPSLQPAIISRMNIDKQSAFGTVHSGSGLTHITTPTGTIESIPGFEPAFKAEVNFGADWLSFDADGSHGRIELRAIAKTDKGHAIDFRYNGILKLDDNAHKLFTGHPDAKSAHFGASTGSASFLVGDPALKALENHIFVTNARIIRGENGLSVETKISLVVASTDAE
ncbi:hypothetical protein PT974_09886 [Cladobotryum mycophilum]|uniref:Uncharacterized protein n=1 Tax=Cladobotryum mycophilum TaxID=491253 RepID=A0ABR0SHJ8_9HYPO